jgi:hypothetical protein
LAGWLVDHFVLSDIGHYGIIFMNVCVAITVADLMLLRDFGPYEILFLTIFTTLDFPVILDGQFTSDGHTW